MYEDEVNEKDNTYLSEKDRVLAWTKDVAASTAKEASHVTSQALHPEIRHVEREPPRVIINQVITTPAVVVTRTRQESTPNEEISTKAVIGTVLGATAGAIIAYAMTKSQTEKPHVEQPKRIAQRIIEAPVTYELVQRDNEDYVREHSCANSKPSHHTTATPRLTGPHADDLIPRSEHPHQSCRSFTRSHVEGVTNPPYVTKISVADSGNSRASHASLHEKTARQSNFIPTTEVRSAKDVPLPPSRVTSLITEGREDNKAGKSSVSPKDSVSQLSTRKSGESRKGGSGRSKHGSSKNQDDGDHKSRASKK